MDFGFSAWWETLTTVQQVYWGMAIPFTLIFLFQLIATFIGNSSKTEEKVEHEGEDGFGFFTIKNFVGLLTTFSWAGVACLDSGMSAGLATFVSLGVGTVMMITMAAISYYFSRLSDSEEALFDTALGNIGEVYLPIEAHRGNVGKVMIEMQGSLQEIDAITDDPTDLPKGAEVTITEITDDDTLVVTRS